MRACQDAEVISTGRRRPWKMNTKMGGCAIKKQKGTQKGPVKRRLGSSPV